MKKYGISEARDKCYAAAAVLTYWVFKCRDRLIKVLAKQEPLEAEISNFRGSRLMDLASYVAISEG